MKISFFFITLLALPLFSHVTNQDDLAVLKELHLLTKKSLEEQEALLSLLEEYQEKKALFVQDTNDSRAATNLVLSAKKIEESLVHSHLTHLLSEDLLTEVHFFSRIGKK